MYVANTERLSHWSCGFCGNSYSCDYHSDSDNLLDKQKTERRKPHKN